MKQNFVKITSFTLVFCFLGIFGCNNDRNISVICKNNPEICADLHQDSWCLAEKTQLIKQRYQLKDSQSPNGKQLYLQLTSLENYSRCMELAAEVRHVINLSRTEERAQAFRSSTEKLTLLQEQIRTQQDPFMSYYQWTRFGDRTALTRLLAQEKAGEVSEPFLLAHIATYYSNHDAIKAQLLYLKVFDRIQYDDFDPNWLLGLAATYQQQQQFAQNYMLTKANLMLTQQKYSADKMLALLGGDKQRAAQLD
ncbi:MAG: DUF2989 domain-containing protein, partial [Shewanella sp.]